MKVLLVDDHPVIRSALRSFLIQNGFEIVGEASDGLSALKMTQELCPDIIILDIDLPKLDGLGVLNKLKLQSRDYRSLVLTGVQSNEIAVRCIHAGASGYLRKDSDMTELLAACMALKHNNTWFSKEIMNSVRKQDFASTEREMIGQLSSRELSVLRALTRGESNIDIANSLHISRKTVSTYRSRLQHKLQVSNILDLADLAKRNGLI
ncbi:two component transcriptional regulator, LuxR family [Pseudomonas sp. NFR02]|uniref:response regulator transcription factor n=1 Tax=Pseudomonas sp. NFR02 TaxID=1566229 RepID=UPI00091D4989|nr:response regulator transcription factor [Pseudomonas sp. NFR02]SFY22240.1 two component transcriptional regulator, LuxR family [Pseudomonas sp. NFR02]